jgi:hypothetical protein
MQEQNTIGEKCLVVCVLNKSMSIVEISNILLIYVHLLKFKHHRIFEISTIDIDLFKTHRLFEYI